MFPRTELSRALRMSLQDLGKYKMSSVSNHQSNDNLLRLRLKRRCILSQVILMFSQCRFLSYFTTHNIHSF
jgi:hypothetical protein